MIATNDVVTFRDLTAYRVVRSLGYVSGRASQPGSRLQATFRSLGMLIGLAPTAMVTDAERLREPALREMRERGDQLGANAVIDLQFHVTEGADGDCVVVAFGEAVIIAPEEHAQ